jgi:hydrogenase nickel incorporation protein HypA/HybF
MHEFSLINDLMRKIDEIAREHGARRVVSVRVRVGALSQLSPDHFREHFEAAATGTIAEAARLDIETVRDERDPHAQDILLDTVELEDWME